MTEDDFDPISIRGEDLSKTVLRDRRTVRDNFSARVVKPEEKKLSAHIAATISQEDYQKLVVLKGDKSMNQFLRFMVRSYISEQELFLLGQHSETDKAQ